MATTATRLGALGMLTALVVGACSGGFGGAASPSAAPASQPASAARCQRPGVRRGPERGERRAGHAVLLRGRQQRHRGQAPGPDRRVPEAPSQRDDRDRDASRRHRGRQPRQDPPGDRRHARHVLLQLGLAAPGAEPGRHARRPVGGAVHRQHPGVVPADGLRERRHLRRPDRGHARRRHPLQQEDLQRPRARRSPRHGRSSPPTTTRSRRTARQPRCARPTATPGPRSCSSSPTTTTSRRPCPDFADEVHGQQGALRGHARGPGGLPAPAGGASTRAGTRRTSGRTSSTRARSCWPRASAPTTRC